MNVSAASGFDELQAANRALTAEVVHENEQEQQQEEEQEQEQEKIKMSAYTRDDEQANPWLLTSLASRGQGDAFYSLSDFKAKTSQPKLQYPKQLLVSDNVYRTSWVGLGDRRLRTVAVLLEWVPDVSSAHSKRIVRALHAKMIKQGVNANVAAVSSVALLQKDPFLGCGSLADLDRAIEATDPLEGPDRYWIALSLQEAETLRRVLHTPSVKAHKQTLAQSDVALRCIDSFSSEGLVLDRSPRFGEKFGGLGAAKQAVQIFRFFNNEFYYTPEEIEVLLSALKGSTPDERLAHFEGSLRLRRRERNLWDDTPIAKLFTDEKEWHLLSARAKIKHFIDAIQRAIKTRTPPLDPISLFSSFDEAGKGVLKSTQLTRCLESMQLGFSPADIGIVVSTLLGETGEVMPYEEYINAFRLEGFVEMMEKRQREEDEKSAASKRRWQCQMCSYINQSSMNPTCEMCGYGLNGYVVEVPRDQWMCEPSRGGCSMFNSKSLFYCEVCERARPGFDSVRF